MQIHDEFHIDGGVTIRDKPIAGLIKLMNKESIPIKAEDCLQNVSYVSLMTRQKATIPLDWEVGQEANIESYVLRSQQLKIELSDHQDYHRGMPGAVGGTYPIGRLKVASKLEFSGHNSSEGMQMIQKAKDVLQKFYSKPKLT